MKICIIGGGNIGTLLAAEFTFKGHDTWIYSSKPQAWADSIKVFSSDESLMYEAFGVRVTADLKQAVEGARNIFLTLPAFMFKSISK